MCVYRRNNPRFCQSAVDPSNDQCKGWFTGFLCRNNQARFPEQLPYRLTVYSHRIDWETNLSIKFITKIRHIRNTIEIRNYIQKLTFKMEFSICFMHANSKHIHFIPYFWSWCNQKNTQFVIANTSFIMINWSVDANLYATYNNLDYMAFEI